MGCPKYAISYAFKSGLEGCASSIGGGTKYVRISSPHKSAQIRDKPQVRADLCGEEFLTHFVQPPILLAHPSNPDLNANEMAYFLTPHRIAIKRTF